MSDTVNSCYWLITKTITFVERKTNHLFSSTVTLDFTTGIFVVEDTLIIVQFYLSFQHLRIIFNYNVTVKLIFAHHSQY